jgi:hypothetical protein
MGDAICGECDAADGKPDLGSAVYSRQPEFKATDSRVTAYDQTSLCMRLMREIEPDHSVVIARRIIMAKGQVRGNKEVKKPKKPKQVVVPVGSFITPPKSGKADKTQH